VRGLKYMPRKRIDNRAVQRRRSAASLRRFTVVFLLGCLLVLGMIFSGWVKWKQREIVYHTFQLQDRKDDLLERRKRLLMELSHLRAPERAARIAREELGMEQPDRTRIVLVSDPAQAPTEPEGAAGVGAPEEGGR